MAFFAALRAVGLALDKFEVGIRITEHKTGEINGKIGQYLAELVFLALLLTSLRYITIRMERLIWALRVSLLSPSSPEKLLLYKTFFNCEMRRWEIQSAESK